MPKRALPVAEKEARLKAIENDEVKNLANGVIDKIKDCAGWSDWPPAQKWAVVELVRRRCGAPRAQRWCNLTAPGAPTVGAQVLCKGEGKKADTVSAKYIGPDPKQGASGIGYVTYKGKQYISRTRILRNWSE